MGVNLFLHVVLGDEITVMCPTTPPHVYSCTHDQHVTVRTDVTIYQGSPLCMTLCVL